MVLYIKNMVSHRCKLKVEEELSKLFLPFLRIELGVLEIAETIEDSQLDLLKQNLALSGLEIVEDKKLILVEKIKTVIIETIHYDDELPKKNYSDYISEKLNLDYTYLSNVFSEVMGYTIQHYIIVNKIERVKELLYYDELNLTKIAFLLNYSSVAHLSNQFKNVTGFSPSFFKKTKKNRTVNLENI
jgi:AraC-like DNA-binding protein